MASEQRFPVSDEAHLRNALSCVRAEPVLTEHQAGVTIRWFCTPPPKGWVFQIAGSGRRVNCGDFTLLIEPYLSWRH